MPGKTLRVLARGAASAPIHSAHARGMARFVGRIDDYELGTPFTVTDENGKKSQSIMPARVCSAEPTTFNQDDDSSEFTEQLIHLRQGDLWPFDAETARMAGVTFDPKYGGEYEKDGPKLINVAHRDALKALAKAEPVAAAAPAPAAPAPAASSPKTTPASSAPRAEEK